MTASKPKPTPDENAVALKELQREHHAVTQAFEQAADGSRRRQKEIERLQGEGNALRDRLMESTVEVERLRGYLAGRRDAEPPRMVPEQRGEPFQMEAVRLYRASSEAKWWHR